MGIIESCAKFIKPFEGCKLHPYRDIVGFPTIGWGYLLSRDKSIPLAEFKPITQEEADDLLDKEVYQKISAVIRLTKGITLTEPQLIALTDFAFNLGAGSLQSSTLRKCILRQDSPDRIAQEFRKWNKAGGRVVRGLKRRREAEAFLFCGGL